MNSNLQVFLHIFNRIKGWATQGLSYSCSEAIPAFLWLYAWGHCPVGKSSSPQSKVVCTLKHVLIKDLPLFGLELFPTKNVEIGRPRVVCFFLTNRLVEMFKRVFFHMCLNKNQLYALSLSDALSAPFLLPTAVNRPHTTVFISAVSAEAAP